MDNLERRRAHYNTEPQKEDTSKSGGLKIFLQLICCMGIIAGIIFGGSYELPIESTVLGFVQETLDTTTDLRYIPVFVKEKVELWLNTPKLPEGGENTVFNEETPVMEQIFN